MDIQNTWPSSDAELSDDQPPARDEVHNCYDQLYDRVKLFVDQPISAILPEVMVLCAKLMRMDAQQTAEVNAGELMSRAIHLMKSKREDLTDILAQSDSFDESRWLDKAEQLAEEPPADPAELIAETGRLLIELDDEELLNWGLEHYHGRTVPWQAEIQRCAEWLENNLEVFVAVADLVSSMRATFPRDASVLDTGLRKTQQKFHLIERRAKAMAAEAAFEEEPVIFDIITPKVWPWSRAKNPSAPSVPELLAGLKFTQWKSPDGNAVAKIRTEEFPGQARVTLTLQHADGSRPKPGQRVTLAGIPARVDQHGQAHFALMRLDHQMREGKNLTLRVGGQAWALAEQMGE